MPARRTPAELELEASLIEAVAAARAQYREGDPHRVFPLERLADWLCSQGEYRRARPYLREAVKIRREAWGKTHPDLAAALNLQAKVAVAEGKPDFADRCLRRAVECLKHAAPPRPIELAETWNHRAELRFRAGDLPVAKRLCRRAQTVLNGQLEEYPLLMLRLRNNQGAIHLAAGNPRRALGSFVDNLRLVKRLYAADSPALVTHYNNIAEALRRIGHDRRADAAIRRAMKIAVKNFGWKHPVTASAAHHLAGMRSQAGRWTSAAKIYERVYRIRRKLHPAVHVDVLRAALNAAELHVCRQDWLAAERLLEQLRTALETSKAADDATRAAIQVRLARIYLATGRAATADRWLTEAWSRFESQADQHPLLAAEIAIGRGLVQSSRSAGDSAAEFFAQALARLERIHGREHLDVAKLLVEIGRNELLRGAPSAAEAAFVRAESIRSRALGAKHPLTSAAQLYLAEVRCEREDWPAAAQFAQQALNALEQSPEEIACLVAAACQILSRAAMATDRTHDAVKYASRELETRARCHGPDHFDLSPALLTLGRLHAAADRSTDAITALERGLSIAERVKGQLDPAVVPFLEELCPLRAAHGPADKLEPLVQRYLKCQTRAFGSQSTELSMAQDQAAEWFRTAGNDRRAQELNDQADALREMSVNIFGDLM